MIESTQLIQKLYEKAKLVKVGERPKDPLKENTLSVYESFKQSIGSYPLDQTTPYDAFRTDSDTARQSIYDAIENAADSVRTSPAYLTDTEITSLQADLASIQTDLASHADYSEDTALQDAHGLLQIASDQLQEILSTPATIDENQDNYANIATTLESASSLVHSRIEDVANKVRLSTLSPPSSDSSDPESPLGLNIGKQILEDRFKGYEVINHLAKKRFLQSGEETKLENAAAAFSPEASSQANRRSQITKAYQIPGEAGTILDQKN